MYDEIPELFMKTISHQLLICGAIQIAIVYHVLTDGSSQLQR